MSAKSGFTVVSHDRPHPLQARGESLVKVAGTLINMHNIHNLWSPQKCASVNAVQAGFCVELRHLAIARAQTCILVSCDCNADLLSFATVLAIKGLAAAS